MKRFFKSLVVSVLTFEARLVLSRREPKIAVVSGSVGKTSAKEALGTALSARFRVRKSAKSFNSDIGVPLTILDLPNAWESPFGWLKNILRGAWEIVGPGEYPEWLVLEVGADAPGDLAKIFKWLSPDLALITRFPDIPVHVEFYPSPEALILEESIPAKRIKPRGLLVLNSDDAKVRALKESDRARTVTYGFDPGADVLGSIPHVVYTEEDPKQVRGFSFEIKHGEKQTGISIEGALGIQQAYPILAAFAAGLELGISLEELKAAFKDYQTPPGRMRALSGIHGSTIIDDTYNSSPVALTEALKVLKGLSFSRKIAILGDMLELGSYSKETHARGGEEAAEAADILIGVGVRAKGFIETARERGMKEDSLYHFEDSGKAAEFTEKLVREGDVVLVKGSQGIRMERVVEKLLRDPSQKKKLLVRQDDAWQRKS